MRIAHFGDLHFGFRAYHHRTETGVNVRENDVALAFREAVEQVIEYNPDLIVCAGDIFDGPHPTPAVMLEAVRQFRRLQEEASCTIVLLGGNHDSPSVAGDGNPLQLLGECIPQCIVMIDEPTIVNLTIPERVNRVDPPGETVSIVGLPHGTYGADRMLERADAAKASAADVSILAVHAPIEVHGEDRLIYARMSSEAIPVEILRPERWTCVLAGDFHEFLKFGPNACYAGSIENVNAGPWLNTIPEKGWVSYDTETRQLEFHQIAIRLVLECPPIEIEDHMTPNDIMARMALFHAQVNGFEGKIVRYQLIGATANTLKLLDWEDVRKWKSEALHLVIKPVPTERTRDEKETVHEFSSERVTLRKEMEDFITDQFDPGVGVQREHIHVYAGECLVDDA